MSHRWSFSSAFVLTVVAVGAAGHGCSAGSKPSGDGTGAFPGVGGFIPTNGGAPGNGGMTTGNGGVSTGTGGLIGNPIPSNSGGKKPDDCGKLVQPAETIFVDASYTDTIVTDAPLALFVMIDRSSSMVGGFGTGDPTSWPNAQAALTTFVQDPGSVGLDIGLGAFPPMSNQQGDCTGGTDCGTPIVPIAALPQNATPMTNGLNNASPATSFAPLMTPTECGLNGMINRCIEHSRAASEQCVAILVTDGQPTQCNQDAQVLVDIVAKGKAANVLTFALSLPGSNIDFLNQIAVAGGTNAAIPVGSGATGQQQFLAALKSIRGTVSRKETKVIVNTVSTPLPCQFTIPPPKDDKKDFDPDKTDVEFQPPAPAPPRSFKFVPNEAACAGTTESWYYDNPQDPKQVLLCPTACDYVKANTGSSINIVFLCEKRITG